MGLKYKGYEFYLDPFTLVFLYWLISEHAFQKSGLV